MTVSHLLTHDQKKTSRAQEQGAHSSQGIERNLAGATSKALHLGGQYRPGQGDKVQAHAIDHRVTVPGNTNLRMESSHTSTQAKEGKRTVQHYTATTTSQTMPPIEGSGDVAQLTRTRETTAFSERKKNSKDSQQGMTHAVSDRLIYGENPTDEQWAKHGDPVVTQTTVGRQGGSSPSSSESSKSNPGSNSGSPGSTSPPRDHTTTTIDYGRGRGSGGV